jgi:hypothetical protein
MQICLVELLVRTLFATVQFSSSELKAIISAKYFGKNGLRGEFEIERSV